jgi:hypothetical protein
MLFTLPFTWSSLIDQVNSLSSLITTHISNGANAEAESQLVLHQYKRTDMHSKSLVTNTH